ncbi:unnamed protein product, partial [Heterotrigona itama]
TGYQVLKASLFDSTTVSDDWNSEIEPPSGQRSEKFEQRPGREYATRRTGGGASENQLAQCPQCHCLMGFLKTTSGLRTGRDTRRSILRALFGSAEGASVPSGPRGASAIVCQFPVLLGRLPGNCCCCGCCWCCCWDAVATAAAAFNAGKGV